MCVLRGVLRRCIKRMLEGACVGGCRRIHQASVKRWKSGLSSFDNDDGEDDEKRTRAGEGWEQGSDGREQGREVGSRVGR